MWIIGIDPSLRHTGVCVRNTTDSKAPLYTYEVKTGKLPVIESASAVADELPTFFDSINQYMWPASTVICVERQIPNAPGSSAAIQFYMYLIVIEVLDNYFNYMREKFIITPFPMQLKKYMRVKHGVKEVSRKGSITERFKELTGLRSSSHIAESWFMTMMAEDILKQNWTLPMDKSVVKYKIFPKGWKVYGTHSTTISK